MTELNFYRKFVQIMTEGHRMNWHERNSGNLTYRLTESEVKEASAELNNTGRIHELPLNLSGLEGDYFLVTGSGKFFMNIEFAKTEVTGIIKVLEGGDKYEIVFGFDNDTRPTSELPTHLLMQESFKTKGNDNRVVYHCHPTNLNSLGYVYKHDSYSFTAKLWQMATEAAVVVPNGVGILEWMMPGSIEIGQASAKLLDEFDVVVWVHHGVFAVGDTLDNTYGLVAVIEKSAEVAVKVESMNKELVHTIAKQHIVDLGETFGIKLNPKVVDAL